MKIIVHSINIEPNDDLSYITRKKRDIRMVIHYGIVSPTEIQRVPSYAFLGSEYKAIVNNHGYAAIDNQMVSWVIDKAPWFWNYKWVFETITLDIDNMYYDSFCNAIKIAEMAEIL